MTDTARVGGLRVEVDVAPAVRQRRLTVAFRVFLLVPHVVVLWFLGAASEVVTIVGYVAAVFTGRLPDFAWRYQSGYLGWLARLFAYALFLTGDYPSLRWRPRVSPVVVHIPPPVTMNRWAVLFRPVLAVPAVLAVYVVGLGGAVVAVVEWVLVLTLGRTPRPVLQANAAVLRYYLRYQAYVLFMTPMYPRYLSGDDDLADDARAAISWTRPLILTRGARVLVAAYILVGIPAYIAYTVSTADTSTRTTVLTSPWTP
ncbi:DUF4389 domain-containing protein [Tsukamurella soli]|uniref:DUF4389 domain-containing protein n=1 Tax=Tsukamurella soli TaxID=644556 RepID=A0ABP8JQR3_9ACTN